MNTIGTTSPLQRHSADEPNFKVNQKASPADQISKSDGQAPVETQDKKDRVNISEEGRKASAAFQDEMKNDPKSKLNGLKNPEEKDGQAQPGSEEEDDGSKTGGPGGAGGGRKADNGRDSLEKQLEALQKKAAELKKEIDKLKRQAGGDETAAAELKEKEAEEQVLKARIQQISQQLKSLDEGQGGGDKSGEQSAPLT